MSHKRLMILAGFFITVSVAGQKNTETLEIRLPEQKVANSLYKTIRVIDKRLDTTHYGIIQKGAFNRKLKVITEVPLEQQLSSVLNAFNDPSAKEGELVLLIRQFNLAEVTGAIAEKGYCQFRAVLFGSSNGAYQEITRIDTVITVNALDVTKALLRQGSQCFVDFIGHHLTSVPGGKIIGDMNGIASIDILEKSGIPVYTTSQYKEGAYRTWNDFAQQTPASEELYIEFWKSGNTKSVQMKNKKGKFAEIDLDDWYAFIYKDKLYINTEFGIYPLEKKDNDFYFTGKSRSSAKAGEVVAAQLFFGIMGGLIASAGGVGLFDMKIDHLTGAFIRIKEAKK